MLKAHADGKSSLRTIPLDAIVGSLGRCSDFTRSFYPRKDSAQNRWTRIQAALAESRPLPPIQVVQIGEIYFVSDGHHRVSVAREQQMDAIEALVVTAETKVPISPDVQPDELLLQAEYARLLAITHLDEIRPEADLSVTVPGQYAAIEAQIAELHRHMLDHGYPGATLTDAALQWYDRQYLPAAHVVRRHRLARVFQGRTETDLVLWLTEYRAGLEEALGWEIELELAADDLLRKHSGAHHTWARTAGKVTDILDRHGLNAGPSPGAWRKAQGLTGEDECLFGRILVPISGADDDWSAVAQASEIACRENVQLLGLHVKTSQADQEPGQIERTRERFLRHCQATGISGTLAIDEGNVAACISERAYWADLIVLRPHHAPPGNAAARLGCGLRTLIRRCPTPILVVPGAFTALEHPLLAYDGSPKAREALFVAAYLAARGQLPLVVVSVAEDDLNASALLADAAANLEPWRIEATFVRQEGPVPEAILRAAAVHSSDLILMGGYGHSPLVELVSGSVVDEVLRASEQPVLLCR
jgi:nucleotide-binding universal stress UspA family protein